MPESSHWLRGEHLLVVDKRDQQAMMRAILEMIRELPASSRQTLEGSQPSLVKAIIRLEQEYARFDTTLEEIARHGHDLVGALRKLMTDRRLFQAKDELYGQILPHSEINVMMSEGPFESEQAD